MKSFKFINLKYIVLLIVVILVLPSATAILQKTKNTLPKDQNDRLSDMIYVDDDNTLGPWDGSLEHPYQYIQDAIDNSNCYDEIFVFNGTYFESIVVHKTLYFYGECKETTIIDGENCCSVITLTSDCVYINGFTIKNSGNEQNDAGVILNSRYCIIENNNIVENNIGIRTTDTDNEIFHNNFISNNVHVSDENNNIWDQGSVIGGNFWDDYDGVDDDEDGIGETPYDIYGNETRDWYPLIHYFGSIQNLDTKEMFITIQDSIDDSDTNCGHTIFVLNDVYHEHILIYKKIYLLGENKETTMIDGRLSDTVVRICGGRNDHFVKLSGFTVKNSGNDLNDAGIKIIKDECVLKDNIVTSNYHGIYLKCSSDENKMFNNKIMNNTWNGIYIKNNCDENQIFNNTISNNGYAGVGIEESSYNKIYHNIFLDNAHNAYDDSNNLWDNGYPSGGNYWSDYMGEDLYQGPNQDQLGSDGIGDVLYEIEDGMGKDNYPLMQTEPGEDTTEPFVEITSPQNGLYIMGRSLLSSIIKQKTIIIGDILIQVQAEDFESGIEKVEFYLDSEPFAVFTDYEAPYEWDWEDTTLIKNKYELVVIAYDNAGNVNMDLLIARKIF